MLESGHMGKSLATKKLSRLLGNHYFIGGGGNTSNSFPGRDNKKNGLSLGLQRVK